MTFSQLAPNGEEQPWEQRVLRTRDPVPTHRQGVAGGTAILLPGLPFCAILVPVWFWLAVSSLPMVLAGGLALLHLARAFGPFSLFCLGVWEVSQWAS